MDIEQELKNYLGAIVKYANRMYLESSVSDKDDLIQAGTIGMINGLNSFDPEKAKQTGTKKTTYVIQCIRNAILQEANKFYGPLSLPHNKRLRLNAFKKLLNRGLEASEIKTLMKMSDAEYERLEDIVKIADCVAVTHTLVDATSEQEKEDLLALLEDMELTDDERQLLRFKIEGMTYSQIAEHYGLSRETMRKRAHKLFDKIKSRINQ